MFFEDIIFNSVMSNNNKVMNDNNKIMNNTKLWDPEEGFMYGNMFKNEYKGYKNYRVSKIIANNDKEMLLLKIYEYDFAINDLSLYLDLHPEDSMTYELFRKYTEEYNKLVSQYERLYGPLEINQSDYQSYEWYKSPWPFEGVDI